MIVRIWHGRTPADKGDAYLDDLKRTGVTNYRATEGNRGVYVLRSSENGVADFLLVSLWDSMDSVRAFAGDRPGTAVYYPEDDAYLLEREPGVRHYEALITP